MLIDFSLLNVSKEIISNYLSGSKNDIERFWSSGVVASLMQEALVTWKMFNNVYQA